MHLHKIEMPKLDLSHFSSALTKRSNIKIKDLESFLAKLSRSVEDGANELTVMADFDFTCTKRWSDEDKKTDCPSSYCVVKRSSLIDPTLAASMKVILFLNVGHDWG